MPHTLINYYRAIESSSVQMLACAAATDWARLVDCERHCGELIEQLGSAARRSGLTPEQRLEKREIMKRILEIDAQIRNLADPSAARYAHRYRDRPTRAPQP